MDTCGQRQIAAGMGLGMHLPVTSGLKQEVQLLLLCPNTYVDSSSPFSCLQATEGWLRLATEQARLSPACRWESMGLNRC